jgi:iron complex outermembrane recepter protein
MILGEITMLKFSLRLCTSMSALALASTAAAQAAEETGDTSVEVKEIIVTAQKRSERLQDVPAAISAIDADALQARGIGETSELAGSLPNLQITSAYGSTQPNFSIRGISVTNEFSASTASPVGVYVDEVYQSFRASHGQQLFDLERVEVLRGPQGTLYGRNTTGGAINFITRKPKLDGVNGYVTGGYANYDTFSAAAAADLTLVDDKLGLRVAGTWSKGDGYIKNPTNNETYASTNSIAGRGILRFKPSDDVDLSLKVYGARNNPRADLPYAVGYLANGTNAFGYSRFLPRPELGGRRLAQDEVQADAGGNFFTSAWGTSFTASIGLGSVDLVSVTGYDEGTYRLSPYDCDGSNDDACAIRYASKSKNFNQDIHLSYASDRLKLIGGLYYGIDTIDTVNEPDFFGLFRPLLLGAGLPGAYNNVPITGLDSLRILPAFALNPALNPTLPSSCAPVVVNPSGFFDARALFAFNTDIALTNQPFGGAGAVQAACAAAGALPSAPVLARQEFTIQRPSTAIYGEGKLSVTDKLSLTVGLRYTWDKVRYKNARTVIFGLDGVTPVASTVPYSSPFNPNLPRVNQSESGGQLTGRAILDYKFAPDILGYASYSRGYRAGSYNGLAYQDLTQVYYIDPEKVDAYEVGLKTRFLDRRVTLNLAGFYYDYANQQINQIIGVTSFLRSANGRVFGGEAELQANLTDRFRFDASLGLLDSKYKGNVINPADPRSLTLNIDGNPFPTAPKTTLSAGLEYDVLSTSSGRLTLRGDTRYTGRYYFDPFQDYGQSPCDSPVAGSNVLQASAALACGNPGYWLFNARATYESDRFTVSAWVKNISNKFYYTYGINLNAAYYDYLTRGAPRTFGVEATVKF